MKLNAQNMAGHPILSLGFEDIPLSQGHVWNMSKTFPTKDPSWPQTQTYYPCARMVCCQCLLQGKKVNNSLSNAIRKITPPLKIFFGSGIPFPEMRKEGSGSSHSKGVKDQKIQCLTIADVSTELYDHWHELLHNNGSVYYYDIPGKRFWTYLKCPQHNTWWVLDWILILWRSCMIAPAQDPLQQNLPNQCDQHRYGNEKMNVILILFFHLLLNPIKNLHLYNKYQP